MWTSSGYRRVFSFLILSTCIFSVTFLYINPNAATRVWLNIELRTRRLGSNHQDLTNETLLESEYLKMFGNTKFDQTSVTSESLFTNKSERPSDVIEVKYEKVFVIVAYRDREENKEVFVKEMNSYLSRKKLNFSIYFVEQNGTDRFNRAKLMNIGVIEAIKSLFKAASNVENEFNVTEAARYILERGNPSVCFIFHDVDMLPENDLISYNCSSSPILLATSVQQFGYQLPYLTYFGGVTAVSMEHFLLINGYPNRYWGWGGEDDDLYGRFIYQNLKPQQIDGLIGRYRSQSHRERQKDEEFEERFGELNDLQKLMDSDGVRQTNFQVLKTTVFPCHTHILAELFFNENKNTS